MKHVVPLTVRDLDRDLVVRTLKKHRCIIFKAADALGVPAYDLRRLICREPDLMHFATAERELIVERAVANLIEALHDPEDPHRRDMMTRFVLNSPMAADRGFTQRETKAGIAEAEKVCRVVYGWAGDPGFGPPARDIMVENVQRARECASGSIEQPSGLRLTARFSCLRHIPSRDAWSIRLATPHKSSN